MRILLSILFLAFIYSVNITAQTAQVSIILEVYDNGVDGGGYKMLHFGLDETASDTIDVHLGESDLPPFPPLGAFEARFILPAGNFSGTLSSYDDFRNANTDPYTGQKIHRLRYQAKDGADTMFFAWQLPVEATGRLQDIITGTIVDVNLTGTGVFAFTTFDALNQLKLTIDYINIPLPVELISFTASVSAQSVQLNWATATEINNAGFEIERSAGTNTNFGIIGYVTGSGTTSETKTYTYTDTEVTTGKYYYRLKQIDFDGSYSYSNEVAVNLDFTPSEFVLSQNYPNPFNPVTGIQFSVPQAGNVIITIYDMLGSEVKTLFSGQVDAGTYTAYWDGLNNAGEQMSSGSYIYKMNAGEFTQSKKMILLK